MLYAQLAAKDDVIGRLLAIEHLAQRRDKESVAKLKDTLNHDGFYGVRVEAANGLRGMHNEEALAALLASTKQPDARVRRQVVDNIGSFYDEKSCEFQRQVLGEEKNPEIVMAAVRDLGGYARPELQESFVKYLKLESYRNELAEAAIGAMRSQDDPAFIPPLLETLSQHQAAFTTHGFAQGLGTLAYLARNEEKKEDVRVFLLSQTNHKKRQVQLAAINALGTLGDPKAIGALSKFTMASKESPQRSAAEQAVATLRAARKPVDDFKNLRQEVLDLQKANRDLRKELDDLKKKVETAQTTPAVEQHKTKAQPKASPKAGGQ
jgi:aminopeptidase N